jgi:membrane protease YdiL (CAAX protease family)
MSLMVGLFEAIFFRGFIQTRLSASFGPIPGVVAAAALYALYHVGYGMGAREMVFLFALGLVYGVFGVKHGWGVFCRVVARRRREGF